MSGGWSRRGVLEGGLLAALSTILAGGSRAAGADSVDALLKRPLITKKIPSTGERLPAIGIGTNAFRSENYDELKALLRRMHELGGTVIDTADDYPNPSTEESEGVIGRALGELGIRSKMFVATKFNAEGLQTAGTPRDKIFGQEAFDRSLQRLQTRKVDLQYIHHPPSIDALMPLLQELKKSGKARYIGISALHAEDHAALADKMHQYPIDFVEVDYSLGNRAAESTVLPAAVERKIAVVVDVPFGGRRGPLLPGVANRPLPPWAADIDVISWSQFLLKYVISHPAITCAIPGSSKVEHLVDNQLAARGRLPDAAMRKKMEAYWDAKA
jgi:aryl-alcohol dehydrogenase-like predicted oxidoreductase